MVAMSWDSKNGSKVPPPIAAVDISPPLPIDSKNPPLGENPISGTNSGTAGTPAAAAVRGTGSEASIDDDRSSFSSNEHYHHHPQQQQDKQQHQYHYPQESMAPPPSDSRYEREAPRDYRESNGHSYSNRSQQPLAPTPASVPLPPPVASGNAYKLRPYDSPALLERDRDENYNRQDCYYPNQQHQNRNYSRDNGYNNRRDYDNQQHHYPPQQYHHQQQRYDSQPQPQRYDSPPPQNYNERQNYNNNNNSYSAPQQRHQELSNERDRLANCSASPGSVKSSESADTSGTHPVLEKLICENNYNPEKYELQTAGARFFIIKSFSEDDVHRSIKYSIWCSTEHGNKRLDNAFRDQRDEGPIYLFFSVNRSGHFCGVAEMVSEVDYRASSGVWSQDKWKGQFKVRWIYVKDVPNDVLRHITLENNENKPVTNSRDTQEVPTKQGNAVLSIIHAFKHSTSIFDDFPHYEQKQEKERPPPGVNVPNEARSISPAVVAAPANDRRRTSSPPPIGNSYGGGNRERLNSHNSNNSNNYPQQNPNPNYAYGERQRDSYNNNGRGNQNGYGRNDGYHQHNNNNRRGDYGRNDGYGRNDAGGYGGGSGYGRYDYGGNGRPQQQQSRDNYQDREFRSGGGPDRYSGNGGYPLRGDYNRQPRNEHFRRNDNGSSVDRDSWRN